MSVQSIDAGQNLGVQRGEAVVCVATALDLERFVDCVRAVLIHSDDEAVLIHGGAAPPSLIDRLVAETRGPRSDRVWTLHAAGEAGLEAVVRAVAPADIVLIDAGCVVGAGWLGRLRGAATADATIATASALVAGQPGAPRSEHRPEWLAEAAATVAGAALRTRPRLAAPSGPCRYIRRGAIELIGDPATADFAARCVRHGLAHVLADDVLVQAPETKDGDVAADQRDPRPPRLAGPVARALSVARRAAGELRVVIDARILAGPQDGTRVHVAELIGALAATGEARVTALVSAGLDDRMRTLLERLDGVTLAMHGASATRVRFDLVHRPHQISAPADLAVLGELGERLVITQQDLIGFHNPAHFPTVAAWEGYRGLTRRALAAADAVLFFSEHVRADALIEELLEPGRTQVVRIGVDHAVIGAQAKPSQPLGARMLSADEEMILCLGTDFAHKNRVFALRVVAELQRRHGWAGRLVLAGPHVRYGSSRAEEHALLTSDPGLAAAVVTLDQVSDGEREWLLERATLVLYPTVSEGFGLVPYEAAARGIPCLWAAATALGELLPDTAAWIVPWDAAATADCALVLMRDPAARCANVRAVVHAGAALRWADTGRRLVEIYRAVCDGPPVPAAAVERTGGLMSGGISEDAMRLIGPDGALPADLERPLLALFARPRLARPVSAALRAGYRASQRLGRASNES